MHERRTDRRDIMGPKKKTAGKGRLRVIALLIIDILLMVWILHARSEAKDEELRRKYSGYSGAAIVEAADALRN